MNKKTLIILIGIGVLLFPLDISILLNKVLGMPLHIILWSLFAIFVLYNVKGNSLEEKWRNIKNCIKFTR